MVVDLANLLLAKLRDPKKAKSKYLSSAESKVSWGETNDGENEALIGKMDTNDPAESLFTALIRQLEQYWRVLGIHAADIGHTRINGDFYQGHLKNPNNEGTYHKLSMVPSYISSNKSGYKVHIKWGDTFSEKLHLQYYLEMLWSKTGYFELLGNNHILFIILLYPIEG